MPTVSRLANRGLVIAVVVFVRGVHDLVLAPPHEQFAVTITKAVNDVLIHRGRAGAVADDRVPGWKEAAFSFSRSW